MQFHNLIRIISQSSDDFLDFNDVLRALHNYLQIMFSDIVILRYFENIPDIFYTSYSYAFCNFSGYSNPMLKAQLRMDRSTLKSIFFTIPCQLHRKKRITVSGVHFIFFPLFLSSFATFSSRCQC